MNGVQQLAEMKKGLTLQEQQILDLPLYQFRDSVTDAIRVGVAQAIAYFAPAKDLITEKEVKERYCKGCITIKMLQDNGVKPIDLGKAVNSKKYYSVAQIEELLMGIPLYSDYITKAHREINKKINSL